MAETARGKKIVRVDSYIREDGTRVKQHERSTPDTAKGKQPQHKKPR